LGIKEIKIWKWIINSRHVVNVIPSGSDEIHGMIYQITGDESKLDRAEGVSMGRYIKRTLPVIDTQAISLRLRRTPEP